MAKSLHPIRFIRLRRERGPKLPGDVRGQRKGNLRAIWALAALRESDFELNLALGSCRQSWPFPNPVTNPLPPFAPLASASSCSSRMPLPRCRHRYAVLIAGAFSARLPAWHHVSLAVCSPARRGRSN